MLFLEWNFSSFIVAKILVQNFLFNNLVYIILGVILIPTILFSANTFYIKNSCLGPDDRKPLLIKILRSIIGIIILAMLVSYYLAFSHLNLIWLLLIQQTIVGIFLRFAIPYKINSVDDIPIESNIDKKG